MVWNDLEGKQLQDKIKKGTSKLLSNHFQIQHLELDIWTFEQIDQLQWTPTVDTHWMTAKIAFLV